MPSTKPSSAPSESPSGSVRRLQDLHYKPQVSVSLGETKLSAIATSPRAIGRSCDIRVEIRSPKNGLLLLRFLYGRGFTAGEKSTVLRSYVLSRPFHLNWTPVVSTTEMQPHSNDDDRELVFGPLEDTSVVCIEHKQLPGSAELIDIHITDEWKVSVSKEDLLSDRLCVQVDITAPKD